MMRLAFIVYFFGIIFYICFKSVLPEHFDIRADEGAVIWRMGANSKKSVYVRTRKKLFRLGGYMKLVFFKSLDLNICKKISNDRNNLFRLCSQLSMSFKRNLYHLPEPVLYSDHILMFLVQRKRTYIFYLY